MGKLSQGGCESVLEIKNMRLMADRVKVWRRKLGDARARFGL